MKKMIAILTVLVLCFAFAGAQAYDYNEAGYTYRVKLTDDLATRSGPGTQFTGCGSYRMKGQTVTALHYAYDNGGMLWVEIEFPYNGAYRRAWTGAKRLSISSSQINNMAYDEGSCYLGAGTVKWAVTPYFGPGYQYSAYDRTVSQGTYAWVITWYDGFWQIEYTQSDGAIFRCWIPEGALDF